MSADIRAYLSPTLVLLAFDWEEGKGRDDFLGFAIKREPGFDGAKESWLPNRIGFDGPASNGADLPSNEAPIQKFMWWDNRFDATDVGSTYKYTVVPVLGTKDAPKLDAANQGAASVTLPTHVEHGIGTWFNRAVVSSQAYAREFGAKPKGAKLKQSETWLANGLDDALTGFIKQAEELIGAAYHLTDNVWAIPALAERKEGALVYDANLTNGEPSPNEPAVEELGEAIDFHPREHTTKIMHDKFLVDVRNKKPAAVLTGSANFTTEGLTSQANLLHTFQSAELARLYYERYNLLAPNPSVPATAKQAAWEKVGAVGDVKSLRVFFPPEPRDSRDSIDAVVEAVKAARSSVVFCLFDPTDAQLLKALFDAGDQKKMMFGLVNHIPAEEPGPSKTGRPPAQYAVEIYHRSRENRQVVGYDAFSKQRTPAGFMTEIPGSTGPHPVYVHHKFIVIDAETDDPIVYSGSANMSESSVHNNDENLLELKGSPRLAAIYLAEFMRLYEHYRARTAYDLWSQGHKGSFTLVGDASWAKKAFAKGTPECSARIAMAGRPR